MRKILALSLFFSFAFGQEPSAFNAGGNAPQKSESQIINEKLFNLSHKVQMLEESQEGLKSIFEGQIQRIQNTANKIDLVQGENNATTTEIKKLMDSNFALQNENIEKLKNSISALGALIQKTNTQMQNEINELREQMNALKNNVKDSQVNDSNKAKEALTKQSQEESKEIVVTNAKINEVIANLEDNSTQKLESNINENNATKPQESKALATEGKQQKTTDKPTQDNTAKPKANLKDKPLSEVFKEGEIFLKNKNYESAEEYLQFAVKGNYKPARGNYLLGEVAFEQKKYEDAIYYYKTSATRYDKADYMPRLMLNSAKSFSAINEKENAKRFLDMLISLYPNSSEAKEAKNLLKSF